MKKILSVFLSVLFLLTALPLGAVSVAAATSGPTGFCTWTLDDNGHLTISGNGAMGNYDWECGPWGEEITSVTIEDGVTTIGDFVFYWCTSLTSVTIPDSVTTIGGWAFRYCPSLISVTIPDSVTTIGEEAFACCYSLSSVTVGDSVTTIKDSAFSDCTSLTSVTIPDSVTNIGFNAFSSCTSLTSVTLGDSVTFIGNYAFSGCSSLTTIAVVAENPNYYDVDGVLFNKDITTLILYPCGKDDASYIIPNGITAIKGWAFSWCTSLTSVTIPDSTTTIEESAFSYCTSLTSVTIPEGVTAIERFAFDGCYSLTDVYYTGSKADRENIAIDSPNDPLLNATWHYGGSDSPAVPGEPDVITGTTGDCTWTLDGTHLTISGNGAMGDYDWEGGSWGDDITSVTIEDGVTNVGGSAFFSCGSLTTAIIGDSVTAIEGSAFAECTSLISVTIGNSVITIGNNAFSSCINLTSLTIPDNVTTIGNWTFAGCESLETITIPDSVVTIGEYAFYECYSLTDVYYGGSEEDGAAISIESGNGSLLNAIWHYIGSDSPATPSEPDAADYLEYEIVDGEAVITRCAEDAPAYLEIPSTLGGFPVKTIQNDAFEYCDNLTTLILPDSVTSLEYSAFYYCHNLTSVTFGNNIQQVSATAFFGCNQLSELIVAEDNPYLCTVDGVLFDRQMTKVLMCPDGKAGAFTIPEGVTTIGESAFESCNLSSLTIPASLVELESAALFYCNQMIEFAVAEDNPVFCSVDGILYDKEQTTLLYYTNGRAGKYVIPDGVTTIGAHTFSGCDSSIEVIIPDSVTVIGQYAFYGCDGLSSVVIPGSVTSMEDAFYYCSGLTQLTIDDGVTCIDRCAFSGCWSLTEVIIPDSVDYIDEYAFSNCWELTTVYIPAGVQHIGYGAFAEDYSLTDVYYNGSAQRAETIPVGEDNGYLLEAEWHYGYDADCAHTYDNACDAICNDCGYGRVAEDHVYDNSLDADCNVCGSTDGRYILFVDIDKRITIKEGYVDLLFVPEQTGLYNFYSKSDDDTYGSLLDAEYNELAWDDDGGEGSNFSIGWWLEAGETYYLRAKYLSEYDYGSFVVRVDCIEAEPDYTPGDANGDGKVNVHDLGLLERHLNGWNTEIVATVCDVNGDGKVNVRDLALLERYLNGWDVELHLPA